MDEHLGNQDKKLSVKQRQRKVLELRSFGFTFDEIASKTGYASKGAAYRAYKIALSEIIRPAAEEVIQQELEVLDVAEKSIMIKITMGNLKAIDTLVRIQKRRSKLLGLDKPLESKVEITGDLDIGIVDMRKLRGMSEDEIKAELAKLSKNDPKKSK